MSVSRPKIDPELIKPIQEYANSSFNGNFTKAVNCLITEGLESRRNADLTVLLAHTPKKDGSDTCSWEEIKKAQKLMEALK